MRIIIGKLCFALVLCGLAAAFSCVGMHESAANPCPNNRCQ
jgi:hypothetical protein